MCSTALNGSECNCDCNWAFDACTGCARAACLATAWATGLEPTVSSTTRGVVALMRKGAAK